MITTRLLAVAALLVASLGFAQVTGECGPGRTCTAAKFKATGPGSASVKPAVVSIPANSMVCVDGTTPGGTCNNGVGGVSSETGVHINGTAWLTVNAATGAITANGLIATPGTGPVTVSDTSGLALTGVATGSLPTCGTTVSWGTVQYDTTAQSLKLCSNENWQSLEHEAFAARCLEAGACGEGTNFLGPYDTKTEHSSAVVACSSSTAGTGGATGVVVQLFDTTTTAAIGTCTVAACTAAAGAPGSCTITGTVPSGRRLVLRLAATTDCTTNPTGLTCNVNLKP